jgi:hypothetical protein
MFVPNTVVAARHGNHCPGRRDAVDVAAVLDAMPPPPSGLHPCHAPAGPNLHTDHHLGAHVARTALPFRLDGETAALAVTA